jgi:Protein of unknown function (DUF2927)
MIARLGILPACFAGLLGLSACAPVAHSPDVTSHASLDLALTLPPMKTFRSSAPTRPLRSNAAMARDFLDLTFRLESGRDLTAFTRFEAPVTITVSGRTPPTLIADLDRLLVRLRSEAGIDIHRVAQGPANITVATVPRGELQRLVPQAACFVSPRISSWAEFKATRHSAKADWTTLRVREKMAVFIPDDVAPQEVRDCLHEEIAQALGPLDDLYRLPDSVFNDDNFSTVLTGFDMLMLRVTYAPELHSGMTQAQVAAAVPGILARLNPAGGRGGYGAESETPRAWIGAVETALGPNTPASRRRLAAREAVSMANAAGWTDNREAFALYVLGRLSVADNPDLALASFLQADAIYRSRPETRLQAAHVAMQLAAYALSSGNVEAVLQITGDYIPVAIGAENAALLSQLMLMRAGALDIAGRGAEAVVVRNEALGWARYGFGSDAEVRARAAEIAALAPATRVAAR